MNTPQPPIMRTPQVTVLGGGLAGTEAAWQLASRGIPVTLMEMRPGVSSPAHHTGELAELVCSNSLKSLDPTTAAGELKRELELMGSLLLRVAHATRVAAGGALAVDREAFSREVTRSIDDHPAITVVRQEADAIPASGPVIVATGPLTSTALEAPLVDLVGADRLAFYDAAAPIVDADSLDRSVVFHANRYDKGHSADYLNCPMTREEYETFITRLLHAQRVTTKEFESADLFQACQPIEELARNGTDAPRFGPMKPVGLIDPRTGERPWAVVQLRAENAQATAYNLVGFQTNLTFPEQRAVFRLIPGLQSAEFLRHGVMHRNTFIDAPRLLEPTLALRAHPRIRLAGQLIGTEGYLEAVATGMLAALNVAAEILGYPDLVLPKTTALGSLIGYATDPATTSYQPMHVNWGLVPPLETRVRGKRERYAAYAQRASTDARAALQDHPLFEPGSLSDE
jgi:methylenetetrahydrofolate--tRNA-(uracil-5-)-methyltransferase